MKKLLFKKTGIEIKNAITIRCEELNKRLEKRNIILEEVLNDRAKVRSYMLKQSDSKRYEYRNPPIITRNDIPSEEVEEISQVCKRINELEQEINRLKIHQHLSDNDIFELELNELIRYGFQLE